MAVAAMRVICQPGIPPAAAVWGWAGCGGCLSRQDRRELHWRQGGVVRCGGREGYRCDGEGRQQGTGYPGQDAHRTADGAGRVT
jgi:hypothetical protein